MVNRADTPRRHRADTPYPVDRPAEPVFPRATDLRRAVLTWLGDGKAQGWSPRTFVTRQQLMDRFCWWLENEEEVAATLSTLTPTRMRLFLSYVREPQPKGRWGTDHHTGFKSTRPSTVQTYHRHLRAFQNFCLAEGLLEERPLKNVRVPKVPNDQIKPFHPEQLQLLLDAARRGLAPERGVALILVLVDTGMRVSELCGLRMRDIDRGSGELTVLGKGNKRRQVYMGLNARRALWRYLEAERRDALPEEAVFVSVGGHHVGRALSPSGVLQILKEYGNTSRLQDVRCSPHTLRHTFAVNFLRGGGNLFELQRLMGHEDLTVLRRYVALAEADLAEAHRAASPADRLKLK